MSGVGDCRPNVGGSGGTKGDIDGEAPNGSANAEAGAGERSWDGPTTGEGGKG
jgi:hypothetical protein